MILLIDNIFTDIVNCTLPDSKLKELEKALSFRPEGFQFSPLYNKWIYNSAGVAVRRMWDGWKRQFWHNKKRTYFPTGLFSIVKNFLKQNNIPFTIQDAREKPESNFDLSVVDDFKFHDYQIDAIDTACNATRGIISAATGSGKTILSAGIIAKLNVAPFMFFVTSIDLLTQAKESFESVLKRSNSKLQVGQIGGGIVDIRDVNVCTIQTAVRALGKQWDKSFKFDDEDKDDKTPIEKYKDDIQNVIREAKGAISDECQHWKADTCLLVARELKSAYYTYAMSATPFRDEGDDMLVQSCFGRKIVEISASQLIKDGFLVKPDIKMIHIKGPKSQYKQWQSIYKEQVVENEKYNSMVANITNAYIQNGRSVLVLIKHIDHGKKLETMIPGSVFLSGSSSKQSREAGIKSLRNKYISCIISSSIFDEGVDIKALDTVVLAGQGKSKTRALQRIGRIIRTFTDENGTPKTKATAIDFCIYQKYLKDHAIAREKIYRSEPEFSVEDIHP